MTSVSFPQNYDYEPNYCLHNSVLVEKLKVINIYNRFGNSSLLSPIISNLRLSSHDNFISKSIKLILMPLRKLNKNTPHSPYFYFESRGLYRFPSAHTQLHALWFFFYECPWSEPWQTGFSCARAAFLSPTAWTAHLCSMQPLFWAVHHASPCPKFTHVYRLP